MENSVNPQPGDQVNISSENHVDSIYSRYVTKLRFYICVLSSKDQCCCCRQVASVVTDSVQPHRRQPIKLPRPWDSPGKNTGVGCHFLLQCMKVKVKENSLSRVQLLTTPWTSRLPGSSVHGIFQARVLEWGAIIFAEDW